MNPNIIQIENEKKDKPTLNPALKPFWMAKKALDGLPVRNRILYGGRSSSKSWDAAGFLIFLSCNYRLRICCARQFQARVEESIYTLLKIQIDRFGLSSQFRILDKSIINRVTGSEFVFYGLWKSIDEVKGLEGIDILMLEEAHNLLEKQWKQLEPTIRKNDSQVWILFNPQLLTDFTYKRFVTNPPPGTLKRKINHDENPFLSDTMKRIIQAAKEEDYEEYLHIYEGEPRTDDESVIIKRSWILASVDAHKQLNIPEMGRRRIGFDVADEGADKCAAIYAHGSVVSWADLWKGGEDELLKSCTRVWSAAREFSADVTYDSIGVGATAGAKFNELNQTIIDGRIKYQKFNAGGSVFQPEREYSKGIKNKDQFSNIKAQAWWLIADRFRNTYNAIHKGHEFAEDELISLSSDLPNLESLIDELSTPKRDFDQNGRVKVESKKDLAKRDIASPNLADALIMAFAPEAIAMAVSNTTMQQFAQLGRRR